MYTTLRRTLVLAVTTAAVAGLLDAAHAGPPLICHPVEIGEAQSLPWGSDAFSTKKSYRLGQLIDDTVDILDDDKSVLVHMETLRRAALYTGRDPNLATRLMARLMSRTLDREVSGQPEALAWFDAGYLAQCYHQLGLRLGLEAGVSQGVVGYAWVRRAVEMQPNDPELQFGAAMMTALADIPQHKVHVKRIRSLASADSLVVSNLDVHARKYWAHHRPRRRG